MLKQLKNKKFNYKSRFSIENKTNSSLDETIKENEFVSKWQRARRVNTKRKGLLKGLSMRMLIIILVLLLIGIYVMNF